MSLTNEKLKGGLDAFERLSAARGGLREYFDDALSLLNEAKSNPNKYIGEPPTLGYDPTEVDKGKFEKYTEDKEHLVEYIALIIEKIQAQIKTHQDQETGNMGRKKDFEELLKIAE